MSTEYLSNLRSRSSELSNSLSKLSQLFTQILNTTNNDEDNPSFNMLDIELIIEQLNITSPQYQTLQNELIYQQIEYDHLAEYSNLIDHLNHSTQDIQGLIRHPFQSQQELTESLLVVPITPNYDPQQQLRIKQIKELTEFQHQTLLDYKRHKYNSTNGDKTRQFESTIQKDGQDAIFSSHDLHSIQDQIRQYNSQCCVLNQKTSSYLEHYQNQTAHLTTEFVAEPNKTDDTSHQIKLEKLDHGLQEALKQSYTKPAQT